MRIREGERHELSPRPSIYIYRKVRWVRGRGAHIDYAGIGYVEMHGWMKIIRSAGHGPAAVSYALHCLSLRLDNRRTVEKSSCPIWNHQFSLGVRPYAR